MENIEKTKWVIDPAHSEISFKVKHLMITNIKGVFKEFEGSAYNKADDFSNLEINFSLNAASIDTGSPDRDTHLKSADFFDAENHKKIQFASKSYHKVDDGTYELSGDLTIKGVSKPIKLEVELGGIMKDPWGNEKVGFEVKGKINRKEWGLNWNAPLEAGGWLVSEDVKISCEVQMVKQIQ